MAKIVKQKYIKNDGTKAVYGYLVPIKKDIMEGSGIDTEKPIKVEYKKGMLVITN